jgi:hypothetical protein
VAQGLRGEQGHRAAGLTSAGRVFYCCVVAAGSFLSSGGT